jgi:hypothetical protein
MMLQPSDSSAFVEIGSAFIAGGEAPECVEPGEGAFDDVSDPAYRLRWPEPRAQLR